MAKKTSTEVPVLPPKNKKPKASPNGPPKAVKDKDKAVC
jgi:hypothetical protein